MTKNTKSSQKVNVSSRTIFNRDNLDILKGINSNCIDLIYLDPPFNKKKVFTAPIGSTAEGAEFSDIFREEDIKDEWVDEIRAVNVNMSEYLRSVKTFGNLYNYCYLVYMAVRLLQCHRILKDTGSIYLHCDPTMSHYLKLLMDMIFDEKNFLNEVIWSYSWGLHVKTRWNRKHDVILLYTKKQGKHTFNADEVRVPYSENSIMTKDKKWNKAYNEDGKLPTDVMYIPTINAMSKERVGYPTQKPLALLERLIKASSNEGDTVLDPFCGCATTCIASELLERDWIGIDISKKAYDLVEERLKKEVPEDLLRGEPTFQTSPPKRTDSGNEFAEKQGWVYIITNEQFDDIKVGVAKDVQKRLKSYQTSDPKRGYKVVFEFQSPQYMEIENHIKEKFPRNHEWFRKEDMDDIKTAIKKFAD